jgi:hypothetical protein
MSNENTWFVDKRVQWRSSERSTKPRLRISEFSRGPAFRDGAKTFQRIGKADTPSVTSSQQSIGRISVDLLDVKAAPGGV